MSNQDKVILQLLRSADVLSDDTADITKHFDGEHYPKLPNPDSLEFGEISLNIAKGYEVIAIKNYDGEIVYLPFNVAIRLLDAETNIEDLRTYSIESVEVLSGQTVSLYNDIESFKEEVRLSIETAIFELSGDVTTRINELSGETDTKVSNLETSFDGRITSLEDYVDLIAEALIDRFSMEFGQLSSSTKTQIDTLSADTKTQIQELGDELSQETNFKVSTLSAKTENEITDLSRKVDLISGSTSSEIYEVKVGLEGEINSLDTKIGGELESITDTIDTGLSKVDEDIANLSAETDTKITSLGDEFSSQLSDESSLLNEKIDSLSSTTESLINNVNQRIDSLSANTDTKIDGVRNDVGEEISGINQKLSELSGSTSSEIYSLGVELRGEIEDSESEFSNQIQSLSSETSNNISLLDESLHNEIASVSGSIESDINEISNTLHNEIASVSGETESLFGDVWEKIEEISGATGQVSSGTTKYVDEKISDVEDELHSFSGNVITFSGDTINAINELSDDLSFVEDAILDIDNKIDTVSEELQNKMDTLSGDVILQMSQIKDEAISDANDYTDRRIESLDSASKEYVDGQISTTKSELRDEISSGDTKAKEDSISASKKYTDTKTGQLSTQIKEYVDEKIDEAEQNITNIAEYYVDIRTVGIEDSAVERATGQSSGYTDQKIAEISQTIKELSGETVSGITKVQEEIETLKLGDLADVNVDEVHGGGIELLARSGNTWTSQSVGVATDETYGLVKIGSGITSSDGVISAQKLTVDSSVVEDSANPVSGGAVYNELSQVEEKLSTISGECESIRSDYEHVEDAFSGLVESYTAFSADTEQKIIEISGSVAPYIDIDERLDEIELVHAAAFAQFRKSTGFNVNGEYVPLNESLVDLNMTQAIDYVASQNDSLKSEQGKYKEYIEDDELTTAAAISRLNFSLGFSNNAIYEPGSDALYGMNVRDAIDYLCDGYERFEHYIDVTEQTQLMRSVTYESLLELIKLKKLKAGQVYRITNYQATINEDTSLGRFTTRLAIQESGPKTSNGFDILVTATSKNTLSEVAKVMLHDRSYYFEDCNLESWEIKYSVYNDRSRFYWANENGFGVIFYMKDNYGNEAGYDFKNIVNIFSGTRKFLFNHPINDNADLSMTGAALQNIIKPFYRVGETNHQVQDINYISISCKNARGNILASGLTNFEMIGANFYDNHVAFVKSDTIFSGSTSCSLIGYTVTE